MRTLYDFSPLNRSTVGFDRMMDMLANSTQPEQVDNYPPYNIERLNEDSYRIILAVAGFTSDDLVIVAQENQLIMTGCRADDDGVQYLHRGLAASAFERRLIWPTSLKSKVLIPSRTDRDSSKGRLRLSMRRAA